MTPLRTALLCLISYTAGIASFVTGSYLWLDKRC